MNKLSTDKQIAYSQHYRCFPQMIGSPVTQSVFMYLMDICIHNLRIGKSPSFPISINEIAYERNMTWRTVENTLRTLQKMKLITISDKLCEVDGNRFVSLIYAFSNLKEKQKRKLFIEKLKSGDYDFLKSLGYSLNKSASKELMELKGYVTPEIQSIKKQNSLLGYKNLVDDNYSKKQNILLYNRNHVCEIIELIRKYWNTESFLKEFHRQLNKLFLEEEIILIVKYIFEEDFENESIFTEDKGLCFLTEVVMCFSRKYMYHLAETDVLNSRTENNIIKKNKEVKKVTSLKKQEDFVDLNFLQYLTNNIKSTISLPLNYKHSKIKERFSYFPLEEIESIIADLSYCLNRSDKIFIHQVWKCLLPFYITEQEADNKKTIGIQPYPEKILFSANRIIQDIINPAFQETHNIITAGKVNIQGINYSVTASKLNSEDIKNIIDFKLMEEEEMYIISKKSFRDIYPLSFPKRIKKYIRDDREKDILYMQKIILFGNNQKQELTPIELIIYNFLYEYFNINEDGSIESPKQKLVNRTCLGYFYLTVIAKKLTKKDFLHVLSNNIPDKQNGNLRLKNRMFSSSKINNWNKIKGYKSKIVL